VDGRAPLLLLLCAALAAVSLFAFLSQRNPGRGAGDGGAQGQPAPPADEGAAADAASGEADGLLLLVNPWTPLPEDFVPGELVPVQNDQAVDARAYPDLQNMLGDMSQAGLSPLICSSYRSQERQQELYDNKVQRVMAEGVSREAAQAEAARWVARPGTSEHQTGLAVDIVSLSNQMLDETQESTPEFQWLAENSWKYGFILRYPNDKSEKTGIAYEPWHFRFVGKEAAEEMHDLGLCLEEYLESLAD
ncbi:MAG TPA: M15 family metallopeptidase, partial [Candidatus Spyradocola merdavium]|nr:M15 family metallopeptidase [Candidatus Spyradocola merdavium]